MKQTALKKSRKWNSMVQTRSMVGKNGVFTPPRYSHIYNLRTVKEKNNKGAWDGWEVTVDGPVLDKSIYIQAKAFSASINKGEVLVKYESESETETSGDVPF